MIYDPRTYYIALCEEVSNELTKTVINYLVDHGHIGIENRVTRRELAAAIFGKFTEGNDRKVRKAKEGSPILSSSKQPGYYLPAYREEIDDYVQENINRINALKENNKAVLHLDIPYRPPVVQHQQTLWEGQI